MPSNSSFALPTQHASQESEQSSLVCPPFPNSYLQTLSTSVPYFSNAALNALLAIVTSFANLLVLLAMRRITSIRLPSKLLLCSLVLTDLGAGLVAQPLFASYLFIQGIDPLLVPCWLLEWIGLTSVLFFVVSLLTSAAISLDRYVALFHSLNYQRIVTSTRVSALILVTWSISVFFASTSMWNNALWDVAGIVCPLVSSLICFVAYAKIYRRLRSLKVHPQAQNCAADEQARNAPNMERYRAMASATMWVCVLVVVCYLPFSGVVATMATTGHTVLMVCIREFTYTLLLLNSCLDPFVYCLRVTEIRNDVRKRLRRWFSWTATGCKTVGTLQNLGIFINLVPGLLGYFISRPGDQSQAWELACFLITFAAKLKNMPFAKFAPALLINIDHSSRQYDQFLCLDNIIQGEGGGGGGVTWR